MYSTKLLALIPLCGLAFSTLSYTVDLPTGAVIASDWETLYAKAAKYPNVVLDEKYGGNVIEVDGQIVLATSDELSREIEAKWNSKPAFTAEQDADIEKQMKDFEATGKSPRKGKDLSLEERAICANQRCYGGAICETVNCHVCKRGLVSTHRATTRGYCI